jgi:nucleoside-diphosphate kinase
MQHLKNERTLVIIKPDAIQRSLIGEVTKRYERLGLKLVGLKMVSPNKEDIVKHYTLDPQWRLKTGEKTIKSYVDKGEKPPIDDPYKVTEVLLEKLSRYMTRSPVIVMVWEGMHAVEIVRKITGSTEPLTSDVGTIRGDYMIDSYKISDFENRSVRNIVHASGSASEAQKEIEHWFNKGELVDYRLIQEEILNDVNLDGVNE